MSVKTRYVVLGIAALSITCTPAAAASQSPARARILVDAGRAEAEISPLLYGQFLEFMFEGIKGGLTAELLRDRGFEEAPNAIGLPRNWERYPDDRNDDYGLAFRWDDSVAYPVSAEHFERSPGAREAGGQHSLRVDAGRGVVERHGLYQPRIPVRAAVAYRGYLWLKTTGYEGHVVVALEQDVVGGQTYAETAIRDVRPGDWRKYEFVLRPGQTDPLARFAILFYGRGRVWVDQVSLLPGDAIDGVRADVAERVAALRPAFIRWPGGNVAQDYHWAWGVGPRDRRPVWTNLSWKNEPEPGDFGTDEFIRFSRRVGAEPTLTVNVEGRGATPEEAAAWVEYCNGPATSRYGALRAANGQPEPYRVKYWEIGNEIWGNWVRGHSDAETYARNYQRYVRAMRAVDSTIRFIAVGDNDMEWNRTVLRRTGASIDYLAIHHYYGHDSTQRDQRNLMARPLHFERFYKGVERVAREEVPGRVIRLAINEWGLDLPEARQHSMEAAAYGARLMNVFERSAPLVAMSAVSDLVNGWPGGIIQASRHRVFVTPLYHANQMYATRLGRERLWSWADGPTFDSGAEGRGIPYVDAVASRAADRRAIYVKMVNTDPSRPIETRVEVHGASLRPDAEWELLAADGAAGRNSFATPHVVAPRRLRVRVDGGGFTVRLPASSVSVITLRVR
ncbi:MAG: alpha-L-arabinofuranosidase C-terminal domain-containing protein [Gemmatimonadaceae bacterium]